MKDEDPQCTNTRTPIIRSRHLIVLLTIVFIFVIVASFLILTLLVVLSESLKSVSEKTSCLSSYKHHHLNDSDSSRRVPLCLSERCVQLASVYLSNMDHDIDPCSDFYSFTCGKYAKNHAIPQHATKISVLYEMKQNLDSHLRNILEKSPSENSTKSMRLAQTYYDSCMNADAQNELDAQPLFILISQMGGWKLLTNARFDPAHYQWEITAGQLAAIGVEGLIKVFVHSSFEDRNTQTLMFCPPRLFLEKKKFYRSAPSTNTLLAYYKNYIKSLLRLLGLDMDDNTGVIEYQVNDIIDFERRIANISRTDSIRNLSAISNVMTYGKFRARYPEIRWQLFFNKELRSSLGVLHDDVMVNVMDVGYFDGLSALVKSKPLSSINNYLMWRLVSTFDMYLPMQYRRPAQEFHASVFGTTAEDPQWEHCIREVIESLAMPLSTAYASAFFSTENRKKAEEMIADLKRSMERIILDADWMEDGVKKVALRKLENMRYKTGFPNVMRDEIAVLKLYEGVKMESDRYFDNALQLKKLAIRHGLNRLHNPPSKDEWVSPVIAVDAYHYFTGNEIIFPAAILQFPMFVPEAPFYVNYAAIGFGIGHEITHGYDDLGSQYDEIGNLRAWWDGHTLAMFQKKRECFITQYSNQVEPITQKNVDGRLTIGENIADNGGLRVAYEAYKMRCSLEEDTLAVPGFSFYSPEQLFFIAFANTWCEKVKPSALNYTMENEVHPLGMFRVNVPLQNFPPFSQAFQCPVGSAMNPHKKCRIW